MWRGWQPPRRKTALTSPQSPLDFVLGGFFCILFPRLPPYRRGISAAVAADGVLGSAWAPQAPPRRRLGAGISPSAARASGSDGHSRVSGSGGRRVRLFHVPLLCLGNSLRLVLFRHKRPVAEASLDARHQHFHRAPRGFWRDAASFGAHPLAHDDFDPVTFKQHDALCAVDVFAVAVNTRFREPAQFLSHRLVATGTPAGGQGGGICAPALATAVCEPVTTPGEFACFASHRSR